jgi:hypothetical protein
MTNQELCEHLAADYELHPGFKKPVEPAGHSFIKTSGFDWVYRFPIKTGGFTGPIFV